MAEARPLASVFPTAGCAACGEAPLPAVFSAPIRPDVVRFVHTNMANDKLRPHAVNAQAGMQHSAVSWGEYTLRSRSLFFCTRTPSSLHELRRIGLRLRLVHGLGPHTSQLKRCAKKPLRRQSFCGFIGARYSLVFGFAFRVW